MESGLFGTIQAQCFRGEGLVSHTVRSRHPLLYGNSLDAYVQKTLRVPYRMRSFGSIVSAPVRQIPVSGFEQSSGTSQ